MYTYFKSGNKINDILKIGLNIHQEMLDTVDLILSDEKILGELSRPGRGTLLSFTPQAARLALFLGIAHSLVQRAHICIHLK